MLTDAQGTIDDGLDEAVFSLTAVEYRLGDRLLVKPTTVEIAAGASIALVGHNGSGKSTLLKMLGRHLLPSGGQILFAGRPLHEWPARDFARRLAYLPQHTPSTPGMTVRELVALGRYPWHGALGRFSSADASQVDAAMENTGIAALQDRLVDTLSGGERQRVWLAMLIAQNADCLLLDEPISALDIRHQLEVLSLVRRLTKERKMTVITVLHDINMAARFCDRIIAMHSGRLIANGAPHEIMTPASLADIYNVDMQIIRSADSGRLTAVAV